MGKPTREGNHEVIRMGIDFGGCLRVHAVGGEMKMQRLVAQLREQTAQARTLDEAIAQNPKELGYG